MLVILAPSKTQSVTTRDDIDCTQPLFSEQATSIASICREMSAGDIRELMKVSAPLAESTQERFTSFSLPHSTKSAGPALATFRGDVYSQIRVDQYSAEDLHFAQDLVRILSGLYGILRPLDLMQPYRLEMGAKLIAPGNTTLYQFWGELVTDRINHELKGHPQPVLINCASAEYSRTILKSKLAGTMTTMTFKQKKGGKLKTIAIYAKRARGLFVDWLITNRIDSLHDCSGFNHGGYRFAPDLSSDKEYVFMAELD